VALLVLSPISTTTFFLGRFRESVSFSSWASAFLGSPIMLAYGITTGAPLLFYPMLLAFYLPFVVIPAAIGSMVTMFLVRVLGTVRRSRMVALGVVVLAVTFGYFRGKMVAPNFSDTGTVQAIVDTMGRTQSPFLPSYWMAQGVLSAATGEAGEAVYYFLLLTANALFLLWIATQAAEAWFYPGWSALQGGAQTRSAARGPLRHLDAFFRFLPQPARALMVKETLGYVVDGRCRDTDFILELGFPVYCDLNTPADIVERWAYDTLGEPVTIGTVTIRSGDYLIGDRDGVVIIPAEVVEEVVTETEAVMGAESEMRDAILGGMDAEAAYLKFGKF